MTEKNYISNQLINEKSPYLQQHASNPVHWFPWSDEAFILAKKEQKPVFLSIGYSTCHWCHVMEKESFEDREVADLLNKYFISIKVDREERPDIDNVYMTVTQSLTGSGGWPNSVFMTPDREPFYAGTYFPKNGFGRRPGMMDIISYFGKMWQDNPKKLIDSAAQITLELQDFSTSSSPGQLNNNILEQAYLGLKNSFDPVNGGFGHTPKFPSPHTLLFLLRYWNRTGHIQALEMVEKTLSKMRLGGLFDHIGLGFHRYATDAAWLVPHFEKMLYDQAMLVMTYTEAYHATQKDEYASTASEVLEYVKRELLSKSGGFYAAEDADSEGVEGLFYLWKPDELKQLLTDDEFEIFSKLYNIQPDGNFRDEATGIPTGGNIPYLKKSLNDHSLNFESGPEELNQRIKKIHQKLFDFRENRIHPFKDKKILTDWNGLMIAAFAKAGKLLNNSGYVEIAQKAVQFIISQLQNSDGKLLKRWIDGEAALPAHLNDYAYFIWGLQELYEATFDVFYIEKSVELTKIMIHEFWDDENGGFLMTANKNLIIQNKELYDGAIPSGNSVAMMILIKLFRMLGDTDYYQKVKTLTKSFAAQVNKNPMAYTYFLSAFDYYMGPSKELVVVGGSMEKLRKNLYQKYHPYLTVIFKPGDKSDTFNKLVKFAQNYDLVNHQQTAYLCQDFSCKKPTNDIPLLIDTL